jgi:hypothetical protein
MNKLLVFIGLCFVLISCARNEHYYRAETAYDLYNRKSNQSPIRLTVRQGDTIVSSTRLRNPNGRFVFVRHGRDKGYVQYWGQRYLSSSKPDRAKIAKSVAAAQ